MKVPTFSLTEVAMILVITLSSNSQVQAQANLSTPQKTSTLKFLTRAANTALEKGEFAESKRLLIAGMPLVHRLLQLYQAQIQLGPAVELEQTLNDYQAVHDRTWFDATAPTEDDLVALMAILVKNSEEISELNASFDSDPQHWPQGIKGGQFVAAMLVRTQDAFRWCRALAAKLPAPLLMYPIETLYQKLYPRLYGPFYEVAIGALLAAVYAKNKVVPETLKEIEDQLTRSKASKQPQDIQLELTTIDDRFRVLQSIDSVLSSEKKAIPELTGQIAKLRAAVKAETDRANQLLEEQVAKNRMPNEEGWVEGSRAAMLDSVRQAYTAAYPKETIKRIVLMGTKPSVNWESYWSNNRLVTEYVSYVKAAVAVKQSSEKHRVFYTRFRRVRGPNRSWSKWAYSAHIGSFSILPENIGN